ncbi:MAG: hypothetical protein NTW19_14585 [Planctomycetota bacterium]|nr:hypothetical protein [Planctomycetota bacterium]
MSNEPRSVASRPRPMRDLAWILGGLVLLGAILLKAPGSPAPGRPLPWLEAIFTSTAAVCGAGLSLRDPATRWSPLGQTILGLLIQAGGIAYALAGARVAGAWFDALGEKGDNGDLQADATAHASAQTPTHFRAAHVIVGILALELIGVAALLPAWRGDLSFLHRLGQSLFHSVSAVCSSGLSIAPDGLREYRHGYLTLGVLTPLAVLGGLGVPLLHSLSGPSRAGPRRAAMRLLAVWAMAYLLGVGAILLAQLAPRAYHALALGNEPNQPVYAPLTAGTLGSLLADASFLSAASHAGGFTTQPPDELRPAAQWALIPLMLLGGLPGGTAGGLGLAALAVLLGVGRIRSSDGSADAPSPARQRLVAGAGKALLAVLACWLAGVYLLSLSEPFPVLKLAFEASSALGDSGLSLGVTGDLTAMGRGVLIALMFAGRVVPLGLLARAAEA